MDRFDSTRGHQLSRLARRATLRALHDADYLVADREGAFGWSEVLSGFIATEIAGYNFARTQGHPTSEDVVTLILAVHAQWGRGEPTKTLLLSVVSIWARRNGTWKSVLRHQITL